MQIEFTRTKEDQLVLRMTRNDGSVTWSKIHKGLEAHDVAHYAVESVLGLKNSFFGLIAKGASIQDFDDKDKIPLLPIEALQTEHLVNLLQVEGLNAHNDLDIISLLKEILDENEIPLISDLNAHSLKEIRKVFSEEYNKVSHLQSGERITYNIDFIYG